MRYREPEEVLGEKSTKRNNVVEGVQVYSIADGELVLMLESVSQDGIDALIARKPRRVICLDWLFAGDDQLKTNTVLRMKDAAIDFRTV